MSYLAEQLSYCDLLRLNLLTGRFDRFDGHSPDEIVFEYSFLNLCVAPGLCAFTFVNAYGRKGAFFVGENEQVFLSKCRRTSTSLFVSLTELDVKVEKIDQERVNCGSKFDSLKVGK